MDISLKPGKYVIAVSGGVDSMVLLDILQGRPGIELVIAHFDHGIRLDTNLDRQVIEQAAVRYGLPFIFERGHLGPRASEAKARAARYDFLRRVRNKQKAQAIITAHHQDDLLETAIINILRGTGRKGLSALKSTDEVVRPLLHVTKKQLYDYAAEHTEIVWHEDSTNADENYLRNYVRNHIIKKLGVNGRRRFLQYIHQASVLNPVIDDLLLSQIKKQSLANGLKRSWFVLLPYNMSCEVMAAWIRSQSIKDFDKKTIQRLVVGAKVAEPGRLLDVNAGYSLKVDKTTFSLIGPDVSQKQINSV